MVFKFCTECGTKVAKHYRVCSNCGKQFGNVQDTYDQRQENIAMGGTSTQNFQENKEIPVNMSSIKKSSHTKKASLIIRWITGQKFILIKKGWQD